MARDKVNLDIFWLRHESLEDSASLPEPEVLAREIVDELKAALEQFSGIVESWGEKSRDKTLVVSRNPARPIPMNLHSLIRFVFVDG
jgi:hypothetical protein